MNRPWRMFRRSPNSRDESRKPAHEPTTSILNPHTNRNSGDPIMSDEITQYDLRTDVELERRISDALSTFQVPSLRKIQVLSENGTIFLRGQVHSFYAKQIAHHAASCIAADRSIVDEIT